MTLPECANGIAPAIAASDERFTSHAEHHSRHPSTTSSVPVPERLRLIAARHVSSNACARFRRLQDVQHVDSSSTALVPCYTRALRLLHHVQVCPEWQRKRGGE